MKITARAGSEVFEVEILREDGRYIVEIDGERRVVDAQKLEGDFYSILGDGRSYEVSVERDGDGYLVRHGAAMQRVSMTDPGRQARESAQAAGGPLALTAPMPGKVVRVLVGEGDAVEAGQGVAVVEAMKMENELEAPKAGTIRSIKVTPGQSVDGGATLMVIE